MPYLNRVTSTIIAIIIGAVLGLAIGLFANQKGLTLLWFALIGLLINSIWTNIKLDALSLFGITTGNTPVEEDEVEQAEHGLERDDETPESGEFYKE